MTKTIPMGTVAVCAKGRTGLILGTARNLTNGHVTYKGICLDKGFVGDAWQSVCPAIIGTLDDWVEIRAAEVKGMTRQFKDGKPIKFYKER